MANGKILVVEDDEDLVHMLTYNLGRRGYQTATTLDGMAARSVVEAERPDLILLDILLPGLDGWQICKIIRNHRDEFISEIPIIMLTALGSPQDRLKGMEIGADDYIPKPFSIKEVMLKVDRFMGREKKKRFLNAQIERLEAREDRRTDFHDMLFHELKNQLAIIGGFSKRIAENRSLTPEKYRHCAGVIRECSSSLDTLTEEVLLLLKLESDEASLPLELVSIEETVCQILSGLEQQAQKKNIRIRFEPMQTFPDMHLNATALKLALGNLVENAVKYSPEQSDILVRTDFRPAKGAVIEVHDNGPGIPEKERRKIFDRFYRGGNVKQATQGVGLGLYITKSLIGLMGGTVRVEPGEKVGASFTVTFPPASCHFTR